MGRLWQLPQHLLATLVIRVTGAVKASEHKGASVYLTHFLPGISLGEYIILRRGASRRTVLHEYGHTVQSRMLGPLYLLVVGIPSLSMNLLTRAGVLRADRYYDRWPENWADRLGGVERRSNENEGGA